MQALKAMRKPVARHRNAPRSLVAVTTPSLTCILRKRVGDLKRYCRVDVNNLGLRRLAGCKNHVSINVAVRRDCAVVAACIGETADVDVVYRTRDERSEKAE